MASVDPTMLALLATDPLLQNDLQRTTVGQAVVGTPSTSSAFGSSDSSQLPDEATLLQASLASQAGLLSAIFSALTPASLSVTSQTPSGPQVSNTSPSVATTALGPNTATGLFRVEV